MVSDLYKATFFFMELDFPKLIKFKKVQIISKVNGRSVDSSLSIKCLFL